MANQVGEINVKIGADTAGLNKGVNKSKTKLGELDKSAVKTGAAVDKFSLAAKAGAVALGALAIKSVLIADKFTTISTRVKTATRDTGDFVKVYNDLMVTAQASGVALESSVAAFQNIGASAREIGKTNEDVVNFVDAFQKLGVIGGSTGVEISNAMRQTSQAIAGGVLRAEEFNSIVENTPEVARAIAAGMEMTVGQLRQAVLAGEVLSEDVFNSLLSQTDEINAKMAEMPINIDRGMTMLANSTGNALASMDEMAGVTNGIGMAFAGWSMLLDAAFKKEEELAVVQREMREIQKEINEGQSIFGNTYLDIINKQQKLNDLKVRELELIGVVSKLSRGDVGLNLEAEYNKIISEEMEKQLDAAIATEEFIASRYKAAEGIRKSNEAIAAAAILENEAKAEKLKLLEEEYAWQAALLEFEGKATGEEQALKDQERTKAALEALQETYLTEQELLTTSLQEKQFIIDEALLNEQLTAQEHQDLMTKINQEGADARDKIADAEFKSKLKMTSSGLGMVSSLMNTKNKEMFEIGKKAAIAQAAISGGLAIQNAWRSGMETLGPWAPVVAAGYAAAAAIQSGVNISNISSQSYGGGATGGATTFSGGMPAVNTQPAGGGGGGAPEGGTLTVQGLSASSLFTGDTVAAIAEELLSYQERGGSVVLQG